MGWVGEILCLGRSGYCLGLGTWTWEMMAYNGIACDEKALLFDDFTYHVRGYMVRVTEWYGLSVIRQVQLTGRLRFSNRRVNQKKEERKTNGLHSRTCHHAAEEETNHIRSSNHTQSSKDVNVPKADAHQLRNFSMTQPCLKSLL